MKLTDIIELAKQGYKPNDIKELISLSEPEPEPTPAPAEGEQKTPESDPEQGEPEGAKQDPTNLDDDVDYRSLYEAEKERTSKLQKMITSADMSKSDNKETDTDVFASLMQTFM